MAYPRSMRSRNFKTVKRTSGNFSVSSTTMADLDTTLDIALEAQVGDVIEYGINAIWQSENAWGYLDVATLVAGSVVNYFGGGVNVSSNNVPAWLGSPNVLWPIAGSVPYTLTAGDISSGLVTLRLRTKMSNVASATKSLLATAGTPFIAIAKNLGPPDPH